MSLVITSPSMDSQYENFDNNSFERKSKGKKDSYPIKMRVYNKIMPVMRRIPIYSGFPPGRK